MKKTLVALAVAAVAATSANAAVVYDNAGTKVEVKGAVRLVLEHHKNERAQVNHDGTRVIFRATHDLGDGLSVFGQTRVNIEPARYNSVDVNGQKVKYKDEVRAGATFVGLNAEGVGQVYGGTGDSSLDGIVLADPTYKFDDAFGVVGGTTGAARLLSFQSAEFSGFKFGADYIFGDDQKKDKGYNAGSGFSTSLRYAQEISEGFKLSANAGYSKVKSSKDASTKAWVVGVAVDVSDVNVALDYAESKVGNGDKVKAVQTAVEYAYMDNAKVFAAYRHTRDGEDKLNGYALGTSYNFAKQVETFVEFNKNKEAKGDRAVYAGIRVHF